MLLHICFPSFLNKTFELKTRFYCCLSKVKASIIVVKMTGCKLNPGHAIIADIKKAIRTFHLLVMLQIHRCIQVDNDSTCGINNTVSLFVLLVVNSKSKNCIITFYELQEK